jgi:transposase
MVTSIVVNIVLTTESGKRMAQRDMTEITWNRAGGVPDAELVQQRTRHPSSAEYKLRMLREADECSTPGEVGALLRRERLYVSHLTHWRAQHEAGVLDRVRDRRESRLADVREVEMADLRHRLERLEAELETARDVIAMQVDLSALLEQLASSRSRRAGTMIPRH